MKTNIHPTEPTTYTHAQIEAIQLEAYQKGYKQGYEEGVKSQYYHSVSEDTQNTMIKEELLKGTVLTGLTALNLFGSMKLTTRMSEIASEGFPYTKQWINDKKSGKRYMSYFMTPEQILSMNAEIIK